MDNKSLFHPDDFDRVNKKYFTRLRDQNDISADPSFWFKNNSKAALTADLADIRNYKSDYNNGLKDEKPKIIDILSKWDKTSYDYDNLTLCSSATTGSFILLTYLKNILGIKQIYFETPCYFASLKQAEFLGFDISLVPTYFREEFRPSYHFSESESPKVIWITQPRFCLGNNQPHEDFESLIQLCGKGDVIVVDEATEQHYPSHLHTFSIKKDPRIMKIRSPFKSIGVNGPRLSTIIHNSKHRSLIQNILEQVQGSVDIFSLRFAQNFLSDHSRYFSLLSIVNEQVNNIHEKLVTMCKGTQLTPSLMANGYIGSIAIDFNNDDLSYMHKREQLLQHCSFNKMPVILGATMRFAKDNDREFVRLSYFNSIEDFKLAVKNLSNFIIS